MTEPVTILTTNEVAKMLRLHPMTICKYAARGEIPCIQLGRMYRFREEDIKNWLNQRKNVDETPE